MHTSLNSFHCSFLEEIIFVKRSIKINFLFSPKRDIVFTNSLNPDSDNEFE